METLIPMASPNIISMKLEQGSMACKRKDMRLAKSLCACTMHTKAPATNLNTIAYIYDSANELLRWNNATNNMTYDLNGCPVRLSIGGLG
jgi:hypothetical protein